MEHILGSFYSWTIKSETVAIKKYDKSFFKYNGSEIPMEIRWFFGIEDMNRGDRKEIIFTFESIDYKAFFIKNNRESASTQLYWKQDLENIFKRFFTEDIDCGNAIFEKISSDHYVVTLEKIEPVTEWFVSGNPKKYDVIEAFKELKIIDWQQSTNIKEKDTVYIYVSNTIQAVRYKCRANIVNKKVQTIDDSKYNLSGKFDGTAGRYMELEVMGELFGPAYSRKEMEKHGFSSPQSPVHVPKQVKEYIDLIQKLQHSDEMDSDAHDGSYELMRETIRAYANMEDLSSCDYKDLNLVYLTSVGTWKHGIDAKRKTIYESHLIDEEKERLNILISDIWTKAEQNKYENREDGNKSIGMFGTGFYSFKGKTDENSPRNFIQMCIDIMEIEKDDDIYERCEQTINKKIRGMKAASASMVLHCLKPYSFPIFNSNMGAENIYVYLGIELYKKTELDTYIKNCRAVKNYRDENFTIKNYRIFDIAARELGTYKEHIKIDYLSVLNYLQNNREIPYSDPKTISDLAEKDRFLKIKKKGQDAVEEIKKMVALCEEKYGLDQSGTIKWLDGSNTKTRKYLWAQMKYSNYEKNPISISLFVEMSPILKKARYRISLEIKNDGTDKKQMDQFHRFLDMSLQSDSMLKYVSGSNELGPPNVLGETTENIKEKINNGEYKKIQLCRILEWTDDLTDDNCESAIFEGVKELIPYYEHVIGIEDETYLPSLEEYDPGITTKMWEKFLQDQAITYPDNLKMFKMMLEFGGKSTCANLAKVYGGTHSFYNRLGTAFGDRVYKKTNCPLYKKDDKERIYTIPFIGRYVIEDGKERYSWKMRNELREALESMDLREIIINKKEALTIEYDKNLILYGPPGTGKTYKSAIYAVAICDGKTIDELKDYDEVMKRYEVLKSEGRIEFTTFHQSYGYEEFIEGIMPIVDEEREDIGYKIEPGLFKNFCDNAREVEITSGDNLIDNNAMIWKLTINSGSMNPIKRECFDEGNVRMHFNIDSKNARAFVEDVSIGDVILSFKTRKTIDGIAVVTGEVTELENKENYQTARKVKWLAKDIDVDIRNINNGKILHRQTFAKVPNMKVQKVIALAEENNPELDPVKIEENLQPYVFVIDEINRGNISKIFGELITLIETTKREGMAETASATLPYSGEEFSVPKNVYILGTMNTADRSIALMDTALRRRFQFIEMMPDIQVLRDVHADKVDDLDVAEMLEKINERITFLYDREHTIGHAFFTKLTGKDATIEMLQSIFEKSIIPLLQEYFYEDYQKIQLVLGDNEKSLPELKFVKDEKIVVKDIFKGNVEDGIDLPEKKYSINKDAFSKIDSYKEII
jgi:hypothetical protein